tara:strand:- start:412 stop:990 length:579 start_codon:yes stop_codon:yes gene_type:complete
MVINNLLSGLILFTSFSARTPNDESIEKDDYEISIGFRSEQFYLKRDWERELGENYIDDQIWFEWKPKNFYFKPQYVNKSSRNLQYNKADIRYRFTDYSFGYTGMYSENIFESGLSLGISKKKEINQTLSFEVKCDGYFFRGSDDDIRLDMENYTKVNWKIAEEITLYNILDYDNVKNKEFYKFKIGLEYEL